MNCIDGIISEENKYKEADRNRIIMIANMFMIRDGLLGSIGMGKKIPIELSFFSKEEKRTFIRKARKMRRKAVKQFRKEPESFPYSKKKYIVRPDQIDRHAAQSLMYDVYRSMAKKQLGITD